MNNSNMKYPFYSAKLPDKWPNSPPTLPLPRSESYLSDFVEEEKEWIKIGRSYLPDKGLAGAANVALLLGQPLLLTGEPGTGKTHFAYSLACQLGLKEPLKFEAKSTSTARDLFYVYDALMHFRAVQIAKESRQISQELKKDGEQISQKPKDYINYNALGKAIIWSHEKAKISPEYLPNDFDHPGKPQRSIVLIDEIDKAPRDFPNDILNEIEQNYFRIPELGNVKIEMNEKYRPIVILTSNSEKYLPDAFLRRCIYYDIPFPSQSEGRLEKILKTRVKDFDKLNNNFVAKALNFFFHLREHALQKKPATAELLDWLSVLRSDMFKGMDNPLEKYSEELSYSLTSLVKNKDDIEIARKDLENRLSKK